MARPETQLCEVVSMAYGARRGGHADHACWPQEAVKCRDSHAARSMEHVEKHAACETV
ncbi:hypothetical protein GDI0538 [Gluconacetobacter diazotrophicus PA1 5]|uniref:Uncharacterized protein n=1 Tax=Gluconacetobacter diazotrophicus (strain ATCC 49037 / DSM 5601 / CCUG 37298 / CIP 103539 / LMG 7603 / PAl5) TaxID=272568 RepID=A9H831_GLUDA|nr:hypothetical protein GDI0538 [Gluconacetobacter diazotrophicus PA1 5]